MHRRTLLLSAAALAACPGPGRAAEAALAQAVRAPGRSAKFMARDGARHPMEELAFFGVGPTSSVVEIWPAGGYWTEILAPLLHDAGTYRLALAPADGGPMDAHFAKASAPMREKLAADPATYGRVMLTELGQGHDELAPPGSADVVLTFRNLHNWLGQGDAAEMLAAIRRALKPGGVLGIEDHRGNAARPQDPEAARGYVRQDYAVALAEKAGFELVASSEVGANPRDTADWPKGVWTLPPSLALGDQDRAKYQAVGEADNFVLKFRRTS
jgi:predicted methyltransferase